MWWPISTKLHTSSYEGQLPIGGGAGRSHCRCLPRTTRWQLLKAVVIALQLTVSYLMDKCSCFVGNKLLDPEFSLQHGVSFLCSFSTFVKFEADVKIDSFCKWTIKQQHLGIMKNPSTVVNSRGSRNPSSEWAPPEPPSKKPLVFSTGQTRGKGWHGLPRDSSQEGSPWLEDLVSTE